MKTEDWINQAFRDAQNDAEKAKAVDKKISEFLEENSNIIFDRWSDVIGFQRAISFADRISRDEDDATAAKALMECFCIAGYVLAKIEDKQPI